MPRHGHASSRSSPLSAWAVSRAWPSASSSTWSRLPSNRWSRPRARVPSPDASRRESRCSPWATRIVRIAGMPFAWLACSGGFARTSCTRATGRASTPSLAPGSRGYRRSFTASTVEKRQIRRDGTGAASKSGVFCRPSSVSSSRSRAIWLAGSWSRSGSRRGLDVFVLSSIGEGISNAILEAMASGLPVIATGVGGNVELVRDGLTGCLIEPRRPELLADALTVYFDDPARAAAHGAAGRSRAAEEFGLERMLAGYMALYGRHVALGARP